MVMNILCGLLFGPITFLMIAVAAFLPSETVSIVAKGAFAKFNVIQKRKFIAKGAGESESNVILFATSE